MVGVARIELATPAMSTQCLSRKRAEIRHFSVPLSWNERRTSCESAPVLPRRYRTPSPSPTPPKEQDELIGEGYDDTEDDEDADEEEMSEEQELAVADMGHLLLIAHVSRDVLLDYHNLFSSPFVSLTISYFDPKGNELQFKHRFEGFVEPRDQPTSDNSQSPGDLVLTITFKVVADMWCLE